MSVSRVHAETVIDLDHVAVSTPRPCKDYGSRGSDPATTPQQDATNFDLIIDPTGQPDDSTAAMVDSLHKTNPNLKYVVYLNGCCYMGKESFNYPESSYAHDSSGHRMNVDPEEIST